MKGEVWMKNTTLTLTFNTERLDALTYHMGKKEADLKEELSDYLQKMYEKYVPQAVREYIENRGDVPPVIKKSAKPAVKNPTAGTGNATSSSAEF